MKNSRTRKILGLRKIALLLLILITEIEASLIKIWVGFPRKIYAEIDKISKTHFLTPKRLTIVLCLSMKIKSKVTRTLTKSSIMSAIRNFTILASVEIKSQKSSVAFSDLCVSD